MQSRRDWRRLWFPVTERDEHYEVLKAWGSPEQIRAKLIAIDVMIDANKRRLWLYAGLLGVIKAFLAVAAVWVAVKVMLGDIIGFWR